MRWAWLAMLAACATHRESASAIDAHEAVQTEIHRVEEPSRVTTTVEEYAVVDMPEPTLPGPTLTPHTATEGSRPTRPADGKSWGSAAGHSDVVVLPLHGPLIKLTTTVEERGTVRTDTAAVASATLDAKSEAESSSKPSLGISLWFLVIPAGIAAVAYLLRKRLPFLSWIP